MLDRALVLWFPGLRTATGEDLAELHLHGGRAVVASVEAALSGMPELRRATPGEFTRRAFANGVIDLAEAEGLADLLSAETELQRKAALALAGGVFSEQVTDWRTRLLNLSAQVESALDFSDEDDVAALPEQFDERVSFLTRDLADWLAKPRAETLREGFRVVIAGPPNAGKSTLINALAEKEVAITAPVAGTTRDVVTAAIAIEGIPFLLLDTAGLRTTTSDSIEAIGIERARVALDEADLVLWLGPEGQAPQNAWQIEAQIDRGNPPRQTTPRHRISAVQGTGLDGLRTDLVATARAQMPKPGEVALNRRQHHLIAEAQQALSGCFGVGDPLIVAEHLRIARLAFDSLLGQATTEDMLDTLFARFCIGK